MNPKEILVVDFKSEDLLKANKENISKVIENKKSSFKDYNADAYSLLEIVFLRLKVKFNIYS